MDREHCQHKHLKISESLLRYELIRADRDRLWYGNDVELNGIVDAVDVVDVNLDPADVLVTPPVVRGYLRGDKLEPGLSELTLSRR